jgi:hypothetical protein
VGPHPLQLLDTSSKYRSYFCYKQRVFHLFFYYRWTIFSPEGDNFPRHKEWWKMNMLYMMMQCSKWVISHILLTLNLPVSVILFCKCLSEISEIWHTFKGLLNSYPYIVPLSRIPLTGQEPTLTWCVTLSPSVQFPHVFMYLALTQILVLANHVLMFKTL